MSYGDLLMIATSFPPLPSGCFGGGPLFPPLPTIGSALASVFLGAFGC